MLGNEQMLATCIAYHPPKLDPITISISNSSTKEHPLFETNEHWTGYRWDDSEDGDYSILIWSDNDEVIRRTKILPTEFHKNILNKYIVPNGKHQLTDLEKVNFILPAYNYLINMVIPKANNFYKNTMITP